MTSVNGLPAHIVLVHAIVVLLPLAALLLVLTAVWPAARKRLAGPNALLSLGTLAMVPITTSAGEWLEGRVPASSLLEKHTELGDSAVFFALPIAAIAAIVWWRNREATAATGTAPRRTFLAPTSTIVTGVITVLAFAVAAIGVVGVYRIGDSGAQAAWKDKFSAVSTRQGGQGD